MTPTLRAALVLAALTWSLPASAAIESARQPMAGPPDVWPNGWIAAIEPVPVVAAIELETLPAFVHPTPYDRLVCSYLDWPCFAAQEVMFCESSGRPDATDGINDGLMQIARRYHSHRLRPGESLYDPVVNVRIAHEIWLERGWAAWPYCGRRWM